MDIYVSQSLNTAVNRLDDLLLHRNPGLNTWVTFAGNRAKDFQAAVRSMGFKISSPDDPLQPLAYDAVSIRMKELKRLFNAKTRGSHEWQRRLRSKISSTSRMLARAGILAP